MNESVASVGTLDWGIIAAIFATVSAIASPIITGVVHNHHERKMRRLELEYQNRLKAYEDKLQAFSEFSEAAGAYIQCGGHTQLEFSRICYKIILYVSDDLKPLINNFVDEIEVYQCDINELSQTLFSITQKLSEELGQPPQVPR